MILTRRLTSQFGRAGTDLAILPDGRVAAVIGGQVVLWSFVTDRAPEPLPGRLTEVAVLEATTDGRVVAAGDAWVALVATGSAASPTRVEQPSQPTIFPLAGGQILLSDADGLIVMDERLEPIGSYEGHERSVTSAARLPDGRIASADLSGAIHIWDPTSS